MTTEPKHYPTMTSYQRRKCRQEYVEHQKGLCYHCQQPLDGKPPPEILEKPLLMRLFPPGFLGHPVHLHHCHRTGMTIGAVHAYCNGVLFQYHGE